MEALWVSINNTLINGTETALYVRLANRARKHNVTAPEPTVGQMRNIFISNVRAYNTGNFGNSITGIPGHNIENVHLENCSFFNLGGLKEGDFTDLTKKDAKRHDTTGNASPSTYIASAFEVIEDDKGYPQPTVWGNLPSYGLFVRHVDDFYANNIVFKNLDTDPRVPIIAVDVANVNLKNIMVPIHKNKMADVYLNNCKQTKIDKDLVIKTIKE